MSLEAQAKLLRFLEVGEFYHIGGTEKLTVETRIVSATNKDLEDMIQQGMFRKDLYFRLGVIKVEVPSLNERREDIIPLAEHFLVEFSKKFGKTFTGLSPEAVDVLTSHRWTGNVRELRNFIERGVLVGRGPELTSQDLGIKGAGTRGQRRPREGLPCTFPPIPPDGMDLSSAHQAFERFYIEEALRMAGGNECKAARILNINHHTFRYRRKRLKIRE